MPTEPLFQRLQQASHTVRISFEGRPLTVSADVSVAAALLAHDVGHTRESPVNGRPGAPYCMMGVCFECLVEIEGRPNCQGCLIGVLEGMHVRRQRGAREAFAGAISEGPGDE
jgi:predicted molibdopterin-dependent oxidoreductase YjgC